MICKHKDILCEELHPNHVVSSTRKNKTTDDDVMGGVSIRLNMTRVRGTGTVIIFES